MRTRNSLFDMKHPCSKTKTFILTIVSKVTTRISGKRNGFLDGQKQKHQPRMFSSVKKESQRLENDQISHCILQPELSDVLGWCLQPLPSSSNQHKILRRRKSKRCRSFLVMCRICRQPCYAREP